MSIKVMDAVWEDTQLNQGETLVMLALADWANDYGRCWPSLPQLERKTRISVRGIRGIVDRLIEQGVLEKTIIEGKGVKYIVRPRNYVPPFGSETPEPTSATPERTSPNTSIHTNRPSGAKAPSVSRASGFPAEHAFRMQCVQWAVENMNWTAQSAGAEFDRFKDNAAAKGSTYIDWLAAWRNWCRSPYCKTAAPKREPFRG
jgi:hypothetical protein